MPRALDDLIEAFSSLPGIGRKSAARLAFFLLKRPVEDSRDIAQRIINARESLKPCKICGNLTDDAECEICRDRSRDRSLICVVEEPSDVTAIESIGEYRGLYHVLGGALSPLDGIGPDDLNIKSLKKRIDEGLIEIILATDLTTEGEATASYLLSTLSAGDVKITRIARGLPAGGSLEYADKNTLARALENRTKLDR
ncbi:MAG: recombination protein RecR [Candidatus Zixiibacteriota bacterium]|nr:MAG: recombination protein RecR [candidate division Zixibacteria bacterium]